ncbi:hypothetical protein [Parageobacillus thermoglucosidasius]|uniref:Uncharacterized protein n=3 Tax=Anoxybacillaceae TaxID=3120669 RepID=A0AAN0YP34_PARTM|nr:hypothetical protein [Parageobacillus thermoglucosidasius]AEH48013.1 hypothetical protein Geoth_2078 [Parageobacillus thermoglucosidasius C56-YS93]ALF10754.1 hypothetical protein AOT13_12405 [Parageobacillus thermoglucosidasius]ANZ30832.1 hypothetical protein BCV53_12415 [Parageobacillus thermoglucosidasius]APM81569.1 hypothetical protein BCV54_12425 [Parageobacillus thermoglucosidasius]KJX67649.1 hypothetical protein WH82_16395 [Parageobacillus thermoglucosidasius]
MKKIIKIGIGVFGIVAFGIGLLIFVFLQSMKADEDEVKKVKIQAQGYIKNTFKDEIVIYDTLFDNMGNFPTFDYAAKAENKKDNTQFLIYYNEETKQMEDTYIAEKWEKELENNIRPYIEQKLGTLDEFWVEYDERAGITYNVNPNKPSSYKEYDAAPTILISVPRKPDKKDEEILNEIVAFLQKDVGLKHGTVSMSYIKNGAPLDDKEWFKTF